MNELFTGLVWMYPRVRLDCSQWEATAGLPLHATTIGEWPRDVPGQKYRLSKYRDIPRCFVTDSWKQVL